MRHFRRILTGALLCLALFARPVTAAAQGKPVIDIPAWMLKIKAGFEEAQQWIDMLQVGVDQYNAIAQSNSVQDYIFNSASAVVYWMPDFGIMVNEAEELMNMYTNGKSYIDDMVARGEISPSEAVNMLRDLYNTVQASWNEYEYVTSVILDYGETISNKDRADAVKDCAEKMFGYRFKFKKDQEEKKTKSNTRDITKEIYNNARNFFSSNPSKAAIKAGTKIVQAKDINLNKKNSGDDMAKEFDEATGINARSLVRLGYILLAIVGLVYIPYNIYKYTKGERQSLDVLLKIFVGLLIGAALIYFLDFFFLGTNKADIVEPFKGFFRK